MDRLDTLVVDHLNERLFQADRLKDLLACVLTKRAEREAEVDSRVTRLQAEVTEADDKLARLYHMVENGLTELDDILKDRIAALKNDRDRAKAALDRLRMFIPAA